MPAIIVYATMQDADVIRQWVNAESDLDWIVKLDERDGSYHWQTTNCIDTIEESEYCIWPRRSGSLNIPSRSEMADAVVLDPRKGWLQYLPIEGASVPWFGANPAAYTFRFRETGRRNPADLARSDFTWLGNRLASAGCPAHPAAIGGWKRLRQFVERSAFHVPWVATALGKRGNKAFVFPDAQTQLSHGRAREINP